ncbi:MULTISPECIES: VOC family protein [unclassified Arthrobacter]|uniref:VOC family protein n=1 Tax=unclassified Arthrobacter TaxID=235627 RepID=UPI001490DE0E|nr:MULTISPECIES: VOC family protein [unclassified Arthrobacter]NOJ61945.1 VOC family protein [Arthrobacter sp. 147(2020)]
MLIPTHEPGEQLMLRVHPLLHTPDPGQLGAGLVALGLAPASQVGGRLVLDAGGGRITLCPSGPGGEPVTLEFEVGDLNVFAQRTRASGTPAEVVNDPDGVAKVQVSAPSLSFHAGLGERQLPAGPDPALTVVTIWRTPDTAGAAEVLGNIGARVRAGTPAAGAVDFLAKNGGVVAVRQGPRQGFEVVFEYAGDLAVLGERVAAADVTGRVTGGDRQLTVELGAGQQVRVVERPMDDHGVEAWH